MTYSSIHSPKWPLIQAKTKVMDMDMGMVMNMSTSMSMGIIMARVTVGTEMIIRGKLKPTSSL